jgi:hypothetical protein
MEWQTIRSRRDPSFWVPVAVALLLIPMLSLGARFWTQSYLQGLESLHASDPAAATAAAEQGLRRMGEGVCAFALLSSAFLFRYFQLGFREHRLPPAGWWSLGMRRAVVGPGARRLCRVGLALSVLLAAAGVGCFLMVRHLVAALGPSA